MANYAPIIIKNGELQQLQAADSLVVPILNANGGSGTKTNILSVSGLALTDTGAASSSVSSTFSARAATAGPVGGLVLTTYGNSEATHPGETTLNFFGSGAICSGFVIGSNAYPTHMLDVYGTGWFQNTLQVGDGTTSASGELLLNGVAATNEGPYIGFQKSGSTKWYVGLTSRVIGGTSNSFTFFSLANGEVMRIGAGVNIGGTTDPGAGGLIIAGSNSYPCDISSSNATNVISRVTSTNSSSLAAFDAVNNTGSIAEFGVRGSARSAYGVLVANDGYLYSGGHLTLLADGSGVIKFAANGNTERMRLALGLNIGGTTDPGVANLYVGNSSSGTGTSHGIFMFGSNQSFIRMYGQTRNWGLLQNSLGQGDFAIWQSNSAGTDTNATGSDPFAGTIRFLIGSAGAIRFPAYGAGTLVTDSSGNITASSDEALKRNIRPFTRGLKSLLGLNPITYQWTKESGMDPEGDYTGFGSRHTRTCIPEAVSEDLTFSDRPIIAAMVNAIKELNNRLEKFEHANTNTNA
jgi:hypothetical protein